MSITHARMNWSTWVNSLGLWVICNMLVIWELQMNSHHLWPSYLDYVCVTPIISLKLIWLYK